MTQLLPLRLFFPLTLLLILSFVAFAGGPLTPTVRADTDAKTVNFTDGTTTYSAEPIVAHFTKSIARNVVMGEAIGVCTDDHRNAARDAVNMWNQTLQPPTTARPLSVGYLATSASAFVATGLCIVNPSATAIEFVEVDSTPTNSKWVLVETFGPSSGAVTWIARNRPAATRSTGYSPPLVPSRRASATWMTGIVRSQRVGPALSASAFLRTTSQSQSRSELSRFCTP